MKKASKIFKEYLHWFIVGGVALLAVLFLTFGHWSENGKYITLDGKDAQIPEATKKFVEDAEAAFNRIMNEDKPTDEETIREYADGGEVQGKGFYTTIEDILGRILPDGSTPYQCSRYTAWLGTGQSVYSTSHIDYGPVNGKDVTEWLKKNYGFKDIDTPVKGAIGSGGFDTLYGHSAAYLYSTGGNTAMVSDANYVPLAVSTHKMDITGWKWVVPGSYNPEPTPTPTPTPEPTPTPAVSTCDERTLRWGDTLGQIMLECEGQVTWGDTMQDYAKRWVDKDTGLPVFDGWHSVTGVGLYAGHTIIYKRGEV